MKLNHYAVLLLICIGACGYINQGESPLSNPEGKTVQDRFSLPAGYKRIELPENSFGRYLRQVALKPHGSKVYHYDGSMKLNQGAACAVVDIDVGTRDLQQCADAVMRLRAEYLFKQKRYDDIHFNFTNGFRTDFRKWLNGYRIQVKGNNVTWVKQTDVSPASAYYTELKKYLQVVFTYAGTLSLSKELQPVHSLQEIMPGDVFIKGGSPGHAVTVMDVAQNSKGERIFLLSQSYMPAQDIHILVNPGNGRFSPWYESSNNGSNLLSTPEWTFDTNELRRFPQ